MKPKKSKEFIPEVSKELDISQNIVEAVVQMYWKDVWENITNLSSPKIHIENLGDFNIKHWVIEKEINKCEGYFNNTSAKGAQKWVAGLKIKDRIALLNKIKKEVEEENQRKEFIYEHKKLSTSIQEQKTDNPGTIF